MADPKDLLNAVCEAFKDAPYPGDDELTGHRCDECDEVRTKFSKARKREDWLEKPLEVFHGGYASPTMLKPEAYRYFFPLFAAAVLFHWRESDVFSDNIVWTFDPFVYKKDPEQVEERSIASADKRLAVMTERERAAVADVFEYLGATYGEISYIDGEIGRAVANLKAGKVVRPDKPR